MKQTLFTCCLFLLFNYAFSQNVVRDSIEFNNLILEIQKSVKTDLTTAMSLAYKAILVSTAQKNNYNKAQAFQALGNVYQIKGVYDSALLFQKKALKVAQDFHFANVEVSCLNNLGRLYLQKLEPKQAIKYMLHLNKVLLTYQEKNINQLMYNNYCNLGQCYSMASDYKSSMENLINARQMLSKYPDLKNQALVYESLATLYNSLNNRNECIRNMHLCLNSISKYGATIDISKSIYNLSDYFYSLDQCDSGQYYFEKLNQYIAQNNMEIPMFQRKLYAYHLSCDQKIDSAIGVVKELIGYYTSKNQSAKIANSKRLLATLELKKNRIGRHDSLFKQANEIELKNGRTDNVKNSYLQAAALKKNSKYFKGAYEDLVTYDSLKDQTIDSAIQLKLADLALRYETSLKDQKIMEQKNLLEVQANNTRNLLEKKELETKNLYLSLVLALLGISTLFYFIISSKNKRNIQIDNEKINLKYNLIKGKVLPHFSGNVLNNIAYLFESNQQKAGIDYLVKYSELNKDLLRTAELSSWSLQEEMAFLRNYINLEKLRYGSKLQFNVNMEKIVDTQVQVPILVTHTFCKNSIEHGIMSVNGKGSLTVDINEEGQRLEIVITDDGIGIEEAKRRNIHNTGHGLEILKKQFEISNKKNTDPIMFDILPNQHTSGTVVKISIPKHYNFTI